MDLWDKDLDRSGSKYDLRTANVRVVCLLDSIPTPRGLGPTIIRFFVFSITWENLDLWEGAGDFLLYNECPLNQIIIVDRLFPAIERCFMIYCLLVLAAFE